MPGKAEDLKAHKNGVLELTAILLRKAFPSVKVEVQRPRARS